MWHGADKLVSCPLCGAAAREPTLLSGNNFHAVIWSDGREVLPHMPLPAPVVRCHGCAQCYWLADAPVRSDTQDNDVSWWHRVLGKRPRPLADWDGAPEVQEPDEASYLQALAKGWTVGAEDERTLRVLAWWRGNDRFRPDPWGHEPSDVPVAPPPSNQEPPWLDEARRANMVQLVALLAESAEDKLMRAELLRQLGRRDEAMELLGMIDDDRYAGFVAMLRRLCANPDATIGALD